MSCPVGRRVCVRSERLAPPRAGFTPMLVILGSSATVFLPFPGNPRPYHTTKRDCLKCAVPWMGSLALGGNPFPKVCIRLSVRRCKHVMFASRYRITSLSCPLRDGISLRRGRTAPRLPSKVSPWKEDVGQCPWALRTTGICPAAEKPGERDNSSGTSLP